MKQFSFNQFPFDGHSNKSLRIPWIETQLLRERLEVQLWVLCLLRYYLTEHYSLKSWARNFLCRSKVWIDGFWGSLIGKCLGRVMLLSLPLFYAGYVNKYKDGRSVWNQNYPTGLSTIFKPERRILCSSKTSFDEFLRYKVVKWSVE